MSHYTATITKLSKDQSIGIGLQKDENYGLVISDINLDGPLGESGLKKGMKLLTINSIEVSGLPSKEAVKILKEIKATEGKLVLTAEDPADVTFLLTENVRTGDKGKVYKTTSKAMKRDINNAMPTLLKEAGVPTNTFRRVYNLIESELLPVAFAAYQHRSTYNTEMASYTRKQAMKGGWGFGAESNHEKKVYHMVTQGASLERSVDLKATQVKDRANAMLARHNIMATVALESTTLGKYSTKQKKGNEVFYVAGLEFHQIE